MNPLRPELDRFKSEWDAMWRDEDFARRRAKKEFLISWKAQICRKDEEPMIDALRDQGFTGESVWDLVNTREGYPELLPVLERHAAIEYLPPTREGIFRSLTVPYAGPSVLNALKDQWQSGSDEKGGVARWALANAISYIAKGSKGIELVGQLMDDDDYASGPFAARLKKSARGREILAATAQEVLA